MDKEEFERIAPRDDEPGSPAPRAVQPTRVVHPTKARRGFTANRKAAILGSMVIGGVAGAAILGPISSLAASPAPTTTAPSGSASTTTEGTEQADPNGPGGHTEAVTDTSVVAKAIGISEADLQTAVNGGQTVAQVAAAHNVSAKTVIDALVADGQTELAAEVSSGKITQAQADAQKAEITQRATDQVNSSLGGHN
jgi:hypothetical protein